VILNWCYINLQLPVPYVRTVASIWFENRGSWVQVQKLKRVMSPASSTDGGT